jgi:hypothetical protein
MLDLLKKRFTLVVVAITIMAMVFVSVPAISVMQNEYRSDYVAGAESIIEFPVGTSTGTVNSTVGARDWHYYFDIDTRENITFTFTHEVFSVTEDFAKLEIRRDDGAIFWQGGYETSHIKEDVSTGGSSDSQRFSCYVYSYDPVSTVKIINAPAGRYHLYVNTDGYVCGNHNSYFSVSSTNVLSVASAEITAPKKTYTGGPVVSNPKVSLHQKVLTKGVDYSVTDYVNIVNPGIARAKIVGMGKYNDEKSFSYAIIPKNTSIKKIAASKKKLTVRWSPSYGAAGYEVQYRYSYYPYSGAKKTWSGWKTKTVGKSATSKALTGLKKKTTYQVRVRPFVKNGGMKYYAKWSAIKKQKTKK